MAKIRFTGSRLTSTALSSVAGTVVMKMAANSHFPNLAAKVATLSAARTALNAADSNYEAAKATFTEKVNIRRLAIDVMRAAHVSLIGAIESDAMGDPVKLSSSGYELASDPVPTTQPPAMIANLVATTDDGELDLTWEAEPDALSYEVQLTETVDVAASWVQKGLPTKSKLILSGLPRGKRVWVRVRGIGVAGSGAWSDLAAKTVP